MKSVEPSEATLAALDAAVGREIKTVLVPDGYWHEYRAKLQGYDPCQLRIAFSDGVCLEVGAEVRQPVNHPWCEVPVVAVSLFSPDQPALASANSARISWQPSPPLTQMTTAKRLLGYASFGEEVTHWCGSDNPVRAPLGLRLQLGAVHLDLVVDPSVVSIGCVAVGSPDLAVYNTQPTGERNWLSKSYQGRKR